MPDHDISLEQTLITSTPATLAPADRNAVASVLAEWISRGEGDKGRRSRLERYYRSAVNRHALGEILIEASSVLDLSDERISRADQAWAPLLTHIERGWEQRMMLFAAVMVDLQRATFQMGEDLPPMLAPDDADVPGLSDYEVDPA